MLQPKYYHVKLSTVDKMALQFYTVVCSFDVIDIERAELEIAILHPVTITEYHEIVEDDIPDELSTRIIYLQ